MSPHALRRYRAERLLRKEFAGLRSKVLAVVRSQLRAKGVALDPSDLEDCYAQAWHGLYATVLGGEQVENPSAWLVLVTFRRAIDESRAAGRRQLGAARAPADSDASAHALAAAFDPDVAAELDDRAQLRQVFEGLRARLSPREREAASLCYLQGLSRAQAAERMGISAARMGKLMEGAGPGRPGVAGKVGALLDTVRAGGWCEQQSSLMRAFAFGILDPEGERHALAVAHCRECPACRAHVASLRGLASVLPLPLLSPLALAGGNAATGGQGATAGGTPAAKRLAATGLRVGGRAGGGWSGLAGSLKLAVTALVVLGAGYALLGSRAHGNLPAARASGSPVSISDEALSRLPFPALRAPTRRNRSARRPLAALPRSTHGRHPGGATGSREFGPEHVLREAATTPSAATPAPSRNSSRATREFGIE